MRPVEAIISIQDRPAEPQKERPVKKGIEPNQGFESALKAAEERLQYTLQGWPWRKGV